jgi:Spy/CpxP family protein refolding chaperone
MFGRGGGGSDEDVFFHYWLKQRNEEKEEAMKRIALITGILTVALLLSCGMAFAQEIKYKVIEGEPGEEGVKRIEICRTMSPDMGAMMGGACGSGHAGCSSGGTSCGHGGGAMMCSPGGGGMSCGSGDACCSGGGMSCGSGGGAMMCGPGGGGMSCGSGGGAMMCGPGGGGMSCGPGGGAMMCGPGGGGMSCGPGGAKIIKARIFGGPGMGGCGDGGGMMGGACGSLQKLGCLCDYEKCAEMLELSKKQIASLKDIRLASKKACIQAMADVNIARLELNEVMKGCCPDLAKVKVKISAIAELKEDMCLAKVSALQKAQKVLTKEQLDKFRSCKMGACKQKGESCKKACAKEDKKACKKVIKMKKGEMKEHMKEMKKEMKDE